MSHESVIKGIISMLESSTEAEVIPLLNQYGFTPQTFATAASEAGLSVPAIIISATMMASAEQIAASSAIAATSESDTKGLTLEPSHQFDNVAPHAPSLEDYWPGGSQRRSAIRTITEALELKGQSAGNLLTWMAGGQLSSRQLANVHNTMTRNSGRIGNRALGLVVENILWFPNSDAIISKLQNVIRTGRIEETKETETKETETKETKDDIPDDVDSLVKSSIDNKWRESNGLNPLSEIEMEEINSLTKKQQIQRMIEEFNRNAEVIRGWDVSEVERLNNIINQIQNNNSLRDIIGGVAGGGILGIIAGILGGHTGTGVDGKDRDPGPPGPEDPPGPDRPDPDDGDDDDDDEFDEEKISLMLSKAPQKVDIPTLRPEFKLGDAEHLIKDDTKIDDENFLDFGREKFEVDKQFKDNDLLKMTEATHETKQKKYVDPKMKKAPRLQNSFAKKIRDTGHSFFINPDATVTTPNVLHPASKKYMPDMDEFELKHIYPKVDLFISRPKNYIPQLI